MRLRLRQLRNLMVHKSKRLENVHSTAYVHRSARVSRDLSVGEYAFVGPRCKIDPGVTIGRYSMLAAEVAVIGDDHNWNSVGVPIQFSGRPMQSATVIHDDVWVGYGSLIMRGVTIGRGAIVAARAVVTTDVPAFEVVGGVPARRLSVRFSDPESRAIHERVLDGPTIPPNLAGKLSGPTRDDNTAEGENR